MNLLIAVVEIDGATGVIVLAVFATVFVLVALLAWMIMRNTTASRLTNTSARRLSTNIQLPVSRATFDGLVRAGRQALSRPSLTPEQQRVVSGFATTRKQLAAGLRLGLVLGGLVGIGVSIAIYRDYGDDEMILLPVGIIFLVSVGVLVSGIVPSRTIDPIEPIDPELLRNVHVEVGTPALSVQLDEPTTRKALELLDRGLSPESVAREVTVGYGQLSQAEKDQIRGAIELLRER